MGDLFLPLKAEYFRAIAAGTKLEEFRLCTPYWRKRLEGRTFARVVLTLGYPAADDHARRLVLPWRGYRIATITHPHFGERPVLVFAIDVRHQLDASGPDAASGVVDQVLRQVD